MTLELEKLLLTLLDEQTCKTTAQVVQEFRAEYPRQWRELEEEGRRLFGAGCAATQQPATRIAQALFQLAPEQCRWRLQGGEHCWSRRPT